MIPEYFRQIASHDEMSGSYGFQVHLNISIALETCSIRITEALNLEITTSILFQLKSRESRISISSGFSTADKSHAVIAAGRNIRSFRISMERAETDIPKDGQGRSPMRKKEEHLTSNRSEPNARI